MSTYKALLKIGSGLQQIEIQANSLYHAKEKFYKLYGKANVQNVCLKNLALDDFKPIINHFAPEEIAALAFAA